jgi:hypothetical protein
VPTSRWTIALLAVVAALSGTSVASANAHRPKPRCVVPHGWRLVAKDRQAVVISTTNPNLIGSHASPDAPQITEQRRYCLRKVGRFHNFAASLSYSGGLSLVQVQNMILAGVFVAYDTTTTDPRGENGNTDDVYVRNLATGMVKATGPRGNRATTMVLAPIGIAAWIDTPFHAVGTPLPPSGPWFVHTLDGRTGNSATLDSATPSSPADQPLADLSLYQCVAGCAPTRSLTAWWTHQGVWRSARIK